jgi:septal ring factor EnvC (AmiA/AmiB activator)
MTKGILLSSLVAIVLLFSVSCADNSRRTEIEQRRAALKHKQDSTLLASQQELAIVDSTLEAVKTEYEKMKAEVEQHKAELRATADELTALTMLRMRRDSLQVQWDVLGAKIKYIRLKQQEN